MSPIMVHIAIPASCYAIKTPEMARSQWRIFLKGQLKDVKKHTWNGFCVYTNVGIYKHINNYNICRRLNIFTKSWFKNNQPFSSSDGYDDTRMKLSGKFYYNKVFSPNLLQNTFLEDIAFVFEKLSFDPESLICIGIRDKALGALDKRQEPFLWLTIANEM